MTKNIFIKVSGDLFDNVKFIKFLKKLSSYNIIICVGGGTQINQALNSRKIPLKKHGPLGRELNFPKERRLAKEILERNKKRLQALLSAERIKARVIIPVLSIGQVICHINGDEMLRVVYLGFDKLYAITSKSRELLKRQQFSDLPKIKVIGL